MATHAGMRSGRVVAMMSGSLPMLNCMSLNWLSFSLSLRSACAMAVWHSTHHIVGDSCW